MQPTRPGYTTTEFWLTLLTNVGAAVALLAPQLGVKLGDPATIKAVALVAAGIANVVYTLARSHVKAAAVHPLAYAPVPKGVGAAAAPVRAMPFHTGVADEGPDERDGYAAVSDEDHAKALSEHRVTGTRANRPVRKR